MSILRKMRASGESEVLVPIPLVVVGFVEGVIVERPSTQIESASYVIVS